MLQEIEFYEGLNIRVISNHTKYGRFQGQRRKISYKGFLLVVVGIVPKYYLIFGKRINRRVKTLLNMMR